MRILLKISVWALLCILPVLAGAQSYWDFSLGYGRSTYHALRLSFDVVLPGQVTLGAFAQEHLADFSSLSPCYNFGGCDKSDEVTAFGIVGGYAFSLQDKLRLNLRAGLAAVRVDKTKPYNKIDQASVFGFVLEPRIEFLPSRIAGIAVGGYANINRSESLYGLSMDVLLGRLRER